MHSSASKMEGLGSLTLIVKAPNQRIEDQRVACNASWTVKQLKEHLSDVHPEKPVSIVSRLLRRQSCWIKCGRFFIVGQTCIFLLCYFSILISRNWCTLASCWKMKLVYRKSWIRYCNSLFNDNIKIKLCGKFNYSMKICYVANVLSSGVFFKVTTFRKNYGYTQRNRTTLQN